jgi:ABC-type nickel/cobalt efflux system permease component RcnA
VSSRGARWLVAALVTAASVVAPRPALAHPMGNFSISHHAEIRVAAEAVELRYLVDLAEIPTFQEMQDTGIVAEVGHPTVKGYLPGRIDALKNGLRVELNGRPLPLETVSSDVVFPPGAGGLPTLKVGAVFRARMADLAGARVHDLRYRDGNFPDRVGWKEIVAREGAGVVLLSSSAPATDRSDRLASYPTDPLESPPQDLEARLVFARQSEAPRIAAAPPVPPSPPVETRAPPRESSPREAAAAAPSPIESSASAAPIPMTPSAKATPRSAFTELMTTDRLGLGIVLIALAVAAGLGALHALEPGHGKTLVAAYLVGSHGTLRHAALLGLVVTLTHTSAVFLLGGVTLYASRYVVPERLYPWLGLVSGLAVAAVGVSLLLRCTGWRARGHAHDHHHHHHGHDHDHAHDHAHHRDHGHDHDHAHHHHGPGASHDHSHGHHHHVPSGKLSIPALLTLGVTGGIVPCPAALVVLLGAISLHRVGFGLLLIVAFSVGLAAVLIGIGLLMVSARRFASRWKGEGALVTRWLPMTSAVVIVLSGVGLTAQALRAAGVLGPWL